MKRGIFLDTVYILALLNPRDRWHRKAGWRCRIRCPAARDLQRILTEVGDALSHRNRRAWGFDTIVDLRDDPDVRCIAIDETVFSAALDLYRDRHDEDWSLTDCTSFVAMRQRRLTDALTADVHFVQAGFRALMSE